MDGTEIDLPFGMMGHVQPIQKRFSLGDTQLLFFCPPAQPFPDGFRRAMQ
jgi:hypothetical protein